MKRASHSYSMGGESAIHPASSGDGHGDDGQDTPQVSVTSYINTLRRLADFQFSFSMIGMILMVVQLEVAWYLNTAGTFPLCKEQIDPEWCDPREQAKVFPLTNGILLVNILRGLISASTVVSLHYQHRYYVCQCNLLKARNLLPKQATFWRSSKLLWSFVLESFCLAIHAFPGVDSVSQDDPTFLVLVNVMMFCRIFLVARVLRYHSPLNTSNGRFIGALTNVDFSASFIFKTALKDNPGQMVTITFVSLLMVGSYALHVVDSYMCATYHQLQCVPISFWDSAWLLVITILTVGYGDVVPSTNGGRFITIAGGLIGTLLTAITIALTTSYLQLSRAEHKVVTFLKKDSNRRLMRKQACICIQAAYRYHTSKVHALNERLVVTAENKLFEELRKFRNAKRYVLSNDGSDPTDKQITMLETMEVNMDDLKEKIDTLESSLVVETSPVHAETELRGAGTPPSEEPAWAKSLASLLLNSEGKVGELQKEIGRLSEAVSRNIENTNTRLDALESRIAHT